MTISHLGKEAQANDMDAHEDPEQGVSTTYTITEAPQPTVPCVPMAQLPWQTGARIQSRIPPSSCPVCDLTQI